MAPILSVIVVSCFGGLVAALHARDVSTNQKFRPVMKVVRLLQDMKTQLESELEDDRAVHKELDCWCKTNDEEKTKAIALGEASESQLVAYLGEAAAKMAELKAKRDSTLEEVNKDIAALEQARNLRMKDNQDFHADEVNLVEAIKACDQAITVLKEYNPNAADFQQVRSVARHLQQAQVLALGRRWTSGVSSTQMAALKAFLAEADGATSFLAIPGYQSYAPQSGQIYGVLEQLKEDFEKDLADAQGKEKSAVTDFESLKAAKEDEISAGRALIAKLDSEIADLKAQHAQAFKELEDTRAQLELDRTFLASLKKKCSETDEEFDKRVKDRLTEISAVDDTIAILNDDTAFDNFDKTVNDANALVSDSSAPISTIVFLQLQSSSTEEQKQRARLGLAAASLRASAARLESPQLALIASRAQLDAFTKVKQEIDKLVDELNKQQQDEISHRDWCIDDLASNKRSTQEAYDRKTSLLNKIDSLKKNIARLTAEIEETEAAVAEMKKQMKRGGEVREKENFAYQQTVSDQSMTQVILKKALARMQQVYAMLQQPAKVGAAHVALSGNHTDAGNGPARFTKYETNADGSRVVRMLQQVIADSKKMEDDAHAFEEDAQFAYEEFMKDTNAAVNAANKKLVNLNGARASAKEELTLAKSDLDSTMGKLEQLHDTLGDIKGSCDYIMDNFDARQAARAAEVQALKQAKAILSGAS